MEFLLASHNLNKLKELESIFPQNFSLKGLNDINDNDEIQETGLTLSENALIKARVIFDKHGGNIISDDTGLEIEALKGAPGVMSARYAGDDGNSLNNMEKVLSQMKNISNRKAAFKTVIALILDEKEHLFEGIINGNISETMHGSGGFGYDPIFVPEGYSHTFAEMTLEMKNKISHRAKAINSLVEFLNSYKV